MPGDCRKGEALTVDHTDLWEVHPLLRAPKYLSLLEKLGHGGDRVCSVAHHEELAEGDVREDVVGLVLPTDLLGLLPEVRELLG